MKSDYTVEEIIDLLAERTRKFTSNESTSVTHEKANQLLGSIMYCLNVTDSEEVYRETVMNNLVDTGIQIVNSNVKDIRTRFYEGLTIKKESIRKAKELYDIIMLDFNGFQNECYIDTISGGITAFFERYDVQFDATNHIILLDYPLYLNIDTLTGIDLIYEYLKRTSLEQTFMIKFDKKSVERLLYHYHKDWVNQLFNLCSIVVRNAIGCVLVGKPSADLDVNNEEIDILMNIGSKYTEKELEEILLDSLTRIIEQQYDGDTVLCDYLSSGMKEFAYEFKFCVEHECLERLFIKCSSSIEEHPDNQEWFEEGTNMNNENLRNLLEMLAESNDIEYKIALLKQHVSSLDDFRILMEECFIENEYEAVCKSLPGMELEILLKSIHVKKENDEMLHPWEQYLLSTCR